jgi:ATP-dependent RNA helicase DDX18/HAS1
MNLGCLSLQMYDTELPAILQLEKLIGKNYFLNQSAKEAYKAYVRAYDSHHLKQIFDVETLDLAKVAASFGFQVPPAVDLRILCYAVRW